MGIENRRGRAYYYRKRRSGSKVRSVYCGGGETAFVFAEIDRIEGEARELDRRLRAAEIADLDERDRHFLDYFGYIDSMCRVALESDGFHRPKRGRWRKRRSVMSEAAGTFKPGTKDPESAAGEFEPGEKDPEAAATLYKPDQKNTETAGAGAYEHGRVRATLEKVRRGDPDARKAFEALYRDSSPSVRKQLLPIFGGDSFRSAVDRFADMASEGHEGPKRDAIISAMKRGVLSTADELAGPDPSPVERLLADRAALAWHLLNFMEAKDAAWQRAGGYERPTALYWARRIDNAHRQFLSASKALAVVKRLAAPGPLVSVQKTTNRTVNTTVSVTNNPPADSWTDPEIDPIVAALAERRGRAAPCN